MKKKLAGMAIGTGILCLCMTGCFESKEERYAAKLDLGDKYLQEMKYEDALAAYQDALKIDDKKVMAYERLASVYHVEKNYSASRELMKTGSEVMKKEGLKEEAVKLENLGEMAEKHESNQAELERILLYPVCKDGKWGFEDSSEKMICDFVYDEIKEYNTYGFAAVKRDGKWGFIDVNGKEIIPCQYEDVNLFGNTGLAGFMQDGKWGFIDKTGKVVVEAQYEETGSFGSNGLAPVRKDGKWGFIDDEGNIFIDLIYDSIMPFNEYGLAAVEKDGEWSWINENEMEMFEGTFEDLEIEDADIEGSIIVCTDDGKYGLSDYTGEVIQECIYDSMEAVPGYRGLYKVEKDGKYGLIDQNGNIVVDINYGDFTFFDEYHLGREQIELGDTGLYKLNYEEALAYYSGVITLEGKEREAYERIASLYTMQENYDEAVKALEEAIQTLNAAEPDSEAAKRLELFLEIAKAHKEMREKEEGTKLYPMDEDGKWGFQDKDGNVLVNAIYETIKEYNSKGLAAVRKDGKWGFVNANGEEVIACQFDDVHIFDALGYAAFCQDGKWGYMDMTGKVLVEASFEEVSDFSGNGLAAVKLDGKWGWINEKGETVIEPTYDEVSDFDKKGLAAVVVDGKHMWINESGVELESDEGAIVVCQNEDGFVIVKRDGKYYLEDFQGKRILENAYAEIEQIPIWPELYKIKRKGKFGCIDIDGNVVLKPKYDNFVFYDKDHIAYFEKDEDGNVTGLRYEGEEPEAIEGTYYWEYDSEDGNGKFTSKMVFHLDGTFEQHDTCDVIRAEYGYVYVLWDDGERQDMAMPGSHWEHDFEPSPYTIVDGKVQLPWWPGEVPLSDIEITEQK